MGAYFTAKFLPNVSGVDSNYIVIESNTQGVNSNAVFLYRSVRSRAACVYSYNGNGGGQNNRQVSRGGSASDNTLVIYSPYVSHYGSYPNLIGVDATSASFLNSSGYYPVQSYFDNGWLVEYKFTGNFSGSEKFYFKF